MVDRQNIVSTETRAGFAALGWTCQTVTGDIFEVMPGLDADIVTANLFLHHLDDAALARLFAATTARASIESGKYDRYVENDVIARFGRPEDVAKVVRLLLEPDSYLTGQAITVDGGLTLRRDRLG